MSFKKVAPKIDKHVMLSYLLLFNRRLEFDFFKLHPKFPPARAQQTRWKFAAFAYQQREKPKLKSLSKIKKPRIQCFQIHGLNVLLT